MSRIGSPELSLLPDLDDACGRHFRFRDVIESGATWRRTRVDNRPLQRASYSAITALCTTALDPIVDQFGPVSITFGFVSRALDRLIRQSRQPNTTRAIDQHAGCELNSRGRPFCPRLGQAADIRLGSIRSSDVVCWLLQTKISFDWVYLYSDDRPIHLSVGPENHRKVVLMQEWTPGRFMPRWPAPGYFDQTHSSHAVKQANLPLPVSDCADRDG